MTMVTRLLIYRWNREPGHVVMACGYGVYLWCAQSFSAPAVGPGGRLMDHLAHVVAPEVDAELLWGGVLGLGGVLALLGLVTGDRTLRRIAAVLLAALWLLMAACFWTANARSPGFIIYVVIAWGSFTRAFQLGKPEDAPARS
jgi:hypothetical protein